MRQRESNRAGRWILAAAVGLCTTPAAPGAAPVAARTSPAPAGARAAAPDYTLKGDREGTVFQSLTVEGEDRIHVDFDRPELKIELDSSKAPGLEWGSARDVLDRTVPDAMAPLTGLSATQPPDYLARPWLDAFASGSIAHFHPAVEGVERWKLLVADSRGKVVATFAGQGKPPREIEWDGRSSGGALVTPGLTYSYVFEAHDRAGNKRNFVGPGFTVPSYRLETPEGTVLTFAGSSLSDDAPSPRRPASPGAEPGAPELLLEVASWLNQSERPAQTIRVSATARTLEQAQALSDRVARGLGPLVCGDPARIRTRPIADRDAPESGTVVVGPATGAP